MQNESHKSISATELVRNMSVVIDKVRISGQSLYITKGSQTIAKLSPAPIPGYPINNLASLLSSLPKLGKDSKVMSRDLKKIKNNAKLPSDLWD